MSPKEGREIVSVCKKERNRIDRIHLTAWSSPLERDSVGSTREK